MAKRTLSNHWLWCMFESPSRPALSFLVFSKVGLAPGLIGRSSGTAPVVLAVAMVTPAPELTEMAEPRTQSSVTKCLLILGAGSWLCLLHLLQNS
jgi:hypothetical protein